MLRQSEPFVRELLLDGVLAGAGVIVREELEPYIVHGQPFREEHLMPLLACIAAELWARTAAGHVRCRRGSSITACQTPRRSPRRQGIETWGAGLCRQLLRTQAR